MATRRACESRVHSLHAVLPALSRSTLARGQCGNDNQTQSKSLNEVGSIAFADKCAFLFCCLAEGTPAAPNSCYTLISSYPAQRLETHHPTQELSIITNLGEAVIHSTWPIHHITPTSAFRLRHCLNSTCQNLQRWIRPRPALALMGSRQPHRSEHHGRSLSMLISGHNTHQRL